MVDLDKPSFSAIWLGVNAPFANSVSSRSFDVI
jgi:hypothetical protein